MEKKLITGAVALGLGIAGLVGCDKSAPTPTPTPSSVVTLKLSAEHVEAIRGLAQLVKDNHDSRHNSENGDRYTVERTGDYETTVYDTPKSKGVATINYRTIEFLDVNKNGVADEGDRLTLYWCDERKPSKRNELFSDSNLDGMKVPITKPGDKGDRIVEYDPTNGQSTAPFERMLIPERTSSSDDRLMGENKRYMRVVRNLTANLSKK